MRIRTVDGEGVRAYADGIGRVYTEAFTAPPWNEDPATAGRYAERLAADTARPGFRAGLALDEGGAVTGFAAAWTTPVPFPGDGTYGPVAEALGPDRVREWLCGALKVDELAVAPTARGTGTGGALLAAVTEDAPGGRCWLLSSLHAEAALRFYRRAGWQRVPAPVPGRAGLVVLLGPHHPAGAALPR
ncbi:GNAT family N-acetyltransferase [Streptomyces sp. NRRL WC-3549]|uniref:GNAT family N-acetyltransferase n=1 Tax=Streptomyces sp. NRRL WC-3549 TaxID=1463925 RepID=UPI0004CB6406|nr:GNAT family N-acetyltransferase [Streptomyces sp. NRRL WC-3549]